MLFYYRSNIIEGAFVLRNISAILCSALTLFIHVHSSIDETSERSQRSEHF